MPSQLDALCDAVAAHLAAQSDFAGATVLSRRAGELDSDLAQDLGRLGALVLIEVPLVSVGSASRRRPLFDPVQLRVRCIEDPLLNPTGHSAAFLAERVLAHLALWRPSLAEVPGAFPILPAAPCLIALDPLPAALEHESAAELRGWDCCFTTRLLLEAAPGE